MSRIFHRPMFRTGGSAEGGITSGLRQEYKRGRVVEPGGYEGNEDFFDLYKGHPEAWEEYKKTVGEYPKGTSGADFWLNFGTNILAQPGGRPILQTLGTAAKEPLAQLQQQKAMERHGEREESKDFLNTYLAAQATLKGGEAGAASYKHGDKALKALEMQNRIFAHDDTWRDDFTPEEKKAWDREKKRIDIQMDNFETNTGIDLEFIIQQSGGKIEDIMGKYKKELEQNEELMFKDGKPVMDPDDLTTQLTISEYYLDPVNAGDLQLRILEMTGREIHEMQQKMEDEKSGWTARAKGGRIGYQGGELVEQEDVNIMTPQGDVSMQETVEEGAMPDQLSFQELRSRLPAEVTDDIIRLITNSAEALTDFAKIQTQQDVDNFNAKYGVNLVLPSEA